MRDWREQIRRFVRYHRGQRAEIGAKGIHALLPGPRVRGSLSTRPISGGKLRGHMIGVAAELQDVPLGDAQVFEHFPGRMRGALRPPSSKRNRQILDHRFKVRVGSFALEKVEEMLSKRLLILQGYHSSNLTEAKIDVRWHYSTEFSPTWSPR